MRATAIILMTLIWSATSLPIHAASTKDEIKALSAQVEAMQNNREQPCCIKHIG